MTDVKTFLQDTINGGAASHDRKQHQDRASERIDSSCHLFRFKPCKRSSSMKGHTSREESWDCSNLYKQVMKPQNDIFRKTIRSMKQLFAID